MKGKLNLTAVILLVFLIFQYAVGMITNLFVSIPESVSNQYMSRVVFYRVWFKSLQWIVGHGSVFLIIHVIVGSLLVLGSLYMVIISIVVRNGGWVLASIFGAIFIIGAWVNGMFFVAFGQHDVNSLIMSYAFISALICYGIGVIWCRKK